MNVTSQLDLLRELSEAKAQYEELLGWQVSLDVGNQRLVMPVGWTVDAVTMPARLAVVVAAQLRIALVAAPTVAAPGGQWLTFLTAPATRLNLPPELRPARVQLIPRGGQVIIPASFDTQHDPGTWQWVESPRPFCPLPPWSSVIVATKLAASGT